MECPKCKSHSVYIENGTRVCGIKQCTYINLHPISFDNDVRHYQGQKNQQNRYSHIYNSVLDNGGISVDTTFDKQFRKGQKIIKNLCHLLKIDHQKLVNGAQARFISILKLKFKGIFEKKQKDINECGMNVLQDKQKIKMFSIKNIACYSIYSICFQNQLYFQDYNIACWLRISRKAWKKLIKEANKKLKDYIDFIPYEKLWHIILRVCQSRKIAKLEINAMKKLYDKIIQTSSQDNFSPKTVAACIFWKICQHSIKYNHIKLIDICKKFDQYEIPSNQSQKYFDTKLETIKKFYSQKLEKQFYKKYLPQWQGRRKQ